MKNVLLLTLLLLTVSCKQELCDCYHGYVFDENKKPIHNVKVQEQSKRDVQTFTDTSGYFKLKKYPDFSSSLIFSKDGYQIDTIKTVVERYDGVKYIFVNYKPDTLFMKRIE